MFEEILKYLDKELANIEKEKSIHESEYITAYVSGQKSEVIKIKKDIEEIVENIKETLSFQTSDLYQPLTLIEAILHAEAVSYNYEGNYSDLCDGCRQQHRQLADWLKELRDYRRKYTENS